MKKLFSCALDKREIRESVLAPMMARLDGLRMESFKQHARISSRLQAIEDSIEIIAGQLAANIDEKNATDLSSSEKND